MELENQSHVITHLVVSVRLQLAVRLRADFWGPI